MNSRVVVIGDVLLDRDISGVADRLCPDAPVPVLTQTSTSERAGGAGLAGTFLSQDGVEVVLVTGLGTDQAGASARRLLHRDGIQVVDIPYHGETAEKIRLKAGQHPLLRLDRGSIVGNFGEPPVHLVELLGQASAVLVSDYGRGVTTLAAVRRAVADAAGQGVPVVWDPHPRGSTPVAGIRLACPNRSEAAAFSAAHGGDLDGMPAPDPSAVAAEAALLRGVWRVGAVAVTMGAEGAILAEADVVPQRFPAPGIHQGDTCGAGDRFAASATIVLANGGSARDAVAEAVAAASRYVAAEGPASVNSELARKG